MSWLLHSGRVGCFPDNTVECASPYNAITEAQAIFDDVPYQEREEMASDLRAVGIHYFADSFTAGADYVSVRLKEE